MSTYLKEVRALRRPAGCDRKWWRYVQIALEIRAERCDANGEPGMWESVDEAKRFGVRWGTLRNGDTFGAT